MALTLRADISATQTTIDVTGTDAIVEGDVFKVEDEYLLVRGPGSPDPTLTYQRVSIRERGFGGSANATHIAGTALTAANAFSGGGGGSVTVEVPPDAPVAVTNIIAPGAVIADSEADLSGVLQLRILGPVAIHFDDVGIGIAPGIPLFTLGDGDLVLRVIGILTETWNGPDTCDIFLPIVKAGADGHTLISYNGTDSIPSGGVTAVEGFALDTTYPTSRVAVATGSDCTLNAKVDTTGASPDSGSMDVYAIIATPAA